MNTSPSQNEMKRIFEKSIKLLDSSQTQLRDIRDVLKKTVAQLALLNTGRVRSINEKIDAYHEAVEEEMDISVLRKEITELHDALQKGEYSAANEGGLLRRRIADICARKNFLADAASYRELLQELADSDMAEDELVSRLLRLFAEVAESAEAQRRLSDDQVDSVRRFVSNLADETGITAREDMESVDEILANLYRDLQPLLAAAGGGNENNDQATGDDVNINELFKDFLNSLSLHDSVSEKARMLNAELSYPVRDARAWHSVIRKLDGLVNESIAALEQEKLMLQDYVTRIIGQLAEFENYIRKTRDESTRATAESAELDSAVQADIERINHVVADSDDLEMLQHDVQEYLDNIRNSVDANLKAAEERELNLVKGYSTVITELDEAQRESEQLKTQLNDSHHKLLRDELTGLPNRMAFNERASVEYHRWLRDRSPLCLAIWDIDHFKHINDTYGHDIGDRVLKILAKIINARIRKTDMFARYGGEEFVFLMPDTRVEGAYDLNNKLRIKLADAGFHYNDEKCEVTTSVGVSAFTDGDSIEDVMKRADIALYESKDAGRNRCTLSEHDRARLENSGGTD